MNRVVRMALTTVTTCLWTGVSLAAQPSFELDIKELDAVRKNPAKPPVKKAPVNPKQKPAAPQPAVVHGSGDVSRYIVKPGDHIFKILMRDYHLSNAEAERMIPEIARLNQVGDIRRLAVGQTLLIPGRIKTVADQAQQPVVAREKELATPPQGMPEAASPAAVVTSVEAPVTLPAAPETAATPEPEAVTRVTLAPAMAGSSPPAMVPVGTVLAVTINGGDPLSVFLRLADVLQMRVQPNQVIASREGTIDSFSIKVPLYAEAQGKRLVVTGGGLDPFQYTLFRLLEGEGYGVLQFRDTDGFREVTAATLAKLGMTAHYGRFRLLNGQEQEVLGFMLLSQAGKILLTDAPVGGVWTALEMGGQ